MNNYVYVLELSDIIEDCQDFGVWVFKNLEDANRKLLTMRKDFEYNTEQELEIEKDIKGNIKGHIYSYSAFESGNYNNNHFTLTIYKREVL